MPSVGLVVVADEPALFFSSVTAAEGYLEAVDVENGVYPRAYGPHGEVYTVSSDSDRVIIELDKNELPAPRDLKDLLEEVLRARRVDYFKGSSLEDLLSHCERYVDDW